MQSVYKLNFDEAEKMVIETERLVLREMTYDDFQALYKVLADSDIMQHYPYTFDENKVRGCIGMGIHQLRRSGAYIKR